MTIRLFVEGAQHAGTSTVMRLLACQVSAELQRWQFEHSNAVVEWMSYSTNSTTGAPIRLEVVALSSPPIAWVDQLRAQSDAIVLVADSTPGGVQAAQEHLRNLALRLAKRGDVNHALFGLLAHQQDQPGALAPAEVAGQLGFDTDSPVTGTSRSLGGVQYGLALAVRSVLRGFEQGASFPRASEPQSIDQLVDQLVAVEPAPERPVTPIVAAARHETRDAEPLVRAASVAAQSPSRSSAVSEMAPGITMAVHSGQWPAETPVGDRSIETEVASSAHLDQFVA